VIRLWRGCLKNSLRGSSAASQGRNSPRSLLYPWRRPGGDRRVAGSKVVVLAALDSRRSLEDVLLDRLLRIDG
jgi:hypothetical protein